MNSRAEGRSIRCARMDSSSVWSGEVEQGDDDFSKENRVDDIEMHGLVAKLIKV